MTTVLQQIRRKAVEPPRIPEEALDIRPLPPYPDRQWMILFLPEEAVPEALQFLRMLRIPYYRPLYHGEYGRRFRPLFPGLVFPAVMPGREERQLGRGLENLGLPICTPADQKILRPDLFFMRIAEIASCFTDYCEIPDFPMPADETASCFYPLTLAAGGGRVLLKEKHDTARLMFGFDSIGRNIAFDLTAVQSNAVFYTAMQNGRIFEN